MAKQTIGEMISLLRKKNGMTQLQLAEQMNVTDKAVSKWERDLSYPDIHSFPKLAEILGVSVDELMQTKLDDQDQKENTKMRDIVSLILKGIAMAMGIAVVALSVLNQMEVSSAISMLGIGLFSIALYQFL